MLRMNKIVSATYMYAVTSTRRGDFDSTHYAYLLSLPSLNITETRIKTSVPAMITTVWRVVSPQVSAKATCTSRMNMV